MVGEKKAVQMEVYNMDECNTDKLHRTRIERKHLKEIQELLYGILIDKVLGEIPKEPVSKSANTSKILTGKSVRVGYVFKKRSEHQDVLLCDRGSDEEEDHHFRALSVYGEKLVVYFHPVEVGSPKGMTKILKAINDCSQSTDQTIKISNYFQSGAVSSRPSAATSSNNQPEGPPSETESHDKPPAEVANEKRDIIRNIIQRSGPSLSKKRRKKDVSCSNRNEKRRRDDGNSIKGDTAVVDKGQGDLYKLLTNQSQVRVAKEGHDNYLEEESQAGVVVIKESDESKCNIQNSDIITKEGTSQETIGVTILSPKFSSKIANSTTLSPRTSRSVADSATASPITKQMFTNSETPPFKSSQNSAYSASLIPTTSNTFTASAVLAKSASELDHSRCDENDFRTCDSVTVISVDQYHEMHMDSEDKVVADGLLRVNTHDAMVTPEGFEEEENGSGRRIRRHNSDETDSQSSGIPDENCGNSDSGHDSADSVKINQVDEENAMSIIKTGEGTYSPRVEHTGMGSKASYSRGRGSIDLFSDSDLMECSFQGDNKNILQDSPLSFPDNTEAYKSPSFSGKRRINHQQQSVQFGESKDGERLKYTGTYVETSPKGAKLTCSKYKSSKCEDHVSLYTGNIEFPSSAGQKCEGSPVKVGSSKSKSRNTKNLDIENGPQVSGKGTTKYRFVRSVKPVSKNKDDKGDSVNVKPRTEECTAEDNYKRNEKKLRDRFLKLFQRESNLRNDKKGHFDSNYVSDENEEYKYDIDQEIDLRSNKNKAVNLQYKSYKSSTVSCDCSPSKYVKSDINCNELEDVDSKNRNQIGPNKYMRNHRQRETSPVIPVISQKERRLRVRRVLPGFSPEKEKCEDLHINVDNSVPERGEDVYPSSSKIEKISLKKSKAKRTRSNVDEDSETMDPPTKLRKVRPIVKSTDKKCNSPDAKLGTSALNSPNKDRLLDTRKGRPDLNSKMSVHNMLEASSQKFGSSEIQEHHVDWNKAREILTEKSETKVEIEALDLDQQDCVLLDHPSTRILSVDKSVLHNSNMAEIRAVRDVDELSQHHLCYLVSHNDKYIKDIFEGKIPCERHDVYKLGGKLRKDLNHHVHLGLYKDDQIDVVMQELMKVFCKKNFKFLDYIMKVLLPEILIKIYMDVHGVSHKETEERMQNALDTPGGIYQ